MRQGLGDDEVYAGGRPAGDDPRHGLCLVRVRRDLVHEEFFGGRERTKGRHDAELGDRAYGVPRGRALGRGCANAA